MQAKNVPLRSRAETEIERRNSMKKLIAIMLAAMMCLSVLPFAAMAAGSYYVAGTASLCGSEWAKDDPANMMQENADGTFSMVYTNVPVGNHSFKVTDGTWDKSWPSENYVFGVTAVCDVTITFNPADGSVSATGANVGAPIDSGIYIVAGTAGLCGSEWTAGDTANAMSKNADGTYSITFTGIAAGKHEFKVTDGSWTNSWPGANYALDLTEAADVTITFNPSDKSVNVSTTGSTGGSNNQQGTSGNPAPADGVYIVAGTAGLCGAEWSTTEIANTMEKNADGTYSLTFSDVPSGNHEFKVTQGDWNMQAWPNDNYKFGVVATCNVTITFNPADGSVIVTGVNVTGPIEGGAQGGNEGGNNSGSSAPSDGTYIIAGTGALCGTEWDTTNTMNTMIKNADGTFSFTYPDVAKGNYEFKVTDGTWDNAWPGENYKFGVSDTCDVTITFNPADCSVSVTGDKVGEPSPDNAGSDATGTIKVYAYVPDSWENPGIWAWDDNQKNAFEAWPGLAMTKGENGWWYAEVPAWVQNVIINANNGAAQTADLDMAESADMWIPVTIVNGTVSAEIHYSEPNVDDLVKPTTPPTTPPTTAPVVDDNGNEDGGNVVVTVIVSALLIIGSGVAGFFVTKAIIAKKNAQPEAEETETELEQTEETAE